MASIKEAWVNLKKKWPFIWAVFFCYLIAQNFLSILGSVKDAFFEILHTETYDFSLLANIKYYIIEIASIIVSNLILFVAVVFLIYFFRKIRFYYAILFGLICKWLFPFVLILFVLILRPIDFVLLFEVPIQVYLLFVLDLSLTLVAIRQGIIIGRRIDYLDAKDEDGMSLYGLPKLLWYILTFAVNPIIILLSQASFVWFFAFLDKLLSRDYWARFLTWEGFWEFGSLLMEPLMLSFAIPFFWALLFILYNYGVDAIKNKAQPYRILIITAIFILLPLLVVVIPIIRNKTWFFLL